MQLYQKGENEMKEGREMREPEYIFAGRRTTTATTEQTQMTTGNALGSYQQTTSSKMSDRTTTSAQRTTTIPVTTPVSAATTNTPCGVSVGQYSSYLKDNLDVVRQKCSEFHACTVELYKSENLHRILTGENIQLRNICGLLYQNANGGYRILDNQCSTQARESIKELLGDELSPLLQDNVAGEDSWEKLKTCLDNNPGDNTYIDKLCKLKGNSTAPLCNATDVQTTTETFFNTKLRQYHCTCNTYTEPPATSLRLRPLIGGVCGGSLILLLIVIIIVLCVRQRKLKRRLTTESKRSGKTTSATEESYCTSQGMRDPPQVPEHYIPYQLPATTSHNDYDYLELLPDVACVYHKQRLPEQCHSGTVGNQCPPQDLPYARAEQVAPSPASERKTRASEGPDRSLEEGTYLEKIDMKAMTEGNSEGGFTPLGLTHTLVVRRQSADAEEGECGNPQYFELEPS